MNSEEEKYMLRCIQLAQNGLCNTAPNPMVGAVIVCDGKIIGEGYHVRCGEAHAEVNAIRSVKDWLPPGEDSTPAKHCGYVKRLHSFGVRFYSGCKSNH